MVCVISDGVCDDVSDGMSDDVCDGYEGHVMVKVVVRWNDQF